MKFQNIAPHDLKFEIDGVTYVVPVGGSCEIPDRIAYTIKGRGLPMKPAEDPKAEPKAAMAAPAPAVLADMSEAELEAATAPESVSTGPSRKRK